jgi:hypothetical protein
LVSVEADALAQQVYPSGFKTLPQRLELRQVSRVVEPRACCRGLFAVLRRIEGIDRLVPEARNAILD